MARPLSQIATEILQDWADPHYTAAPYLEAMLHLRGMGDRYGFDEADGIVMYFLTNAGQWKGPKAREIKKELKAMLNDYQRGRHASVSRVADRFRESKGKRPPNLRESKDGLRSCATCAAFRVDGVCTAYEDYKVEASQTCDTWHAEEGE